MLPYYRYFRELIALFDDNNAIFNILFFVVLTVANSVLSVETTNCGVSQRMRGLLQEQQNDQSLLF
jgi:hypothetical protein